MKYSKHTYTPHREFWGQWVREGGQYIKYRIFLFWHGKNLMKIFPNTHISFMRAGWSGRHRGTIQVSVHGKLPTLHAVQLLQEFCQDKGFDVPKDVDFDKSPWLVSDFRIKELTISIDVGKKGKEVFYFRAFQTEDCKVKIKKVETYEITSSCLDVA